MAKETNDQKASSNFKKIAIGAGAIAVTAAAAAAAGAVLSNKDLRKKLSDKANQALEIVSNLAEEAHSQAQGRLKVMSDDAKNAVTKAKKLPRVKAVKKALKK